MIGSWYVEWWFSILFGIKKWAWIFIFCHHMVKKEKVSRVATSIKIIIYVFHMYLWSNLSLFETRRRGLKCFLSLINITHSDDEKKNLWVEEGRKRKKIDFDKTIKTFASCFNISALLWRSLDFWKNSLPFIYIVSRISPWHFTSILHHEF